MVLEPETPWLPDLWLEKQDYEYAFHMGIAAGSASAFSENLATREEIEAVYQQITGKDQEERKK